MFPMPCDTFSKQPYENCGNEEATVHFEFGGNRIICSQAFPVFGITSLFFGYTNLYDKQRMEQNGFACPSLQKGESPKYDVGQFAPRQANSWNNSQN